VIWSGFMMATGITNPPSGSTALCGVLVLFPVSSPDVEDHQFDQEDNNNRLASGSFPSEPERSQLCVATQGPARGLWWLAELLQPLTLGTTHVQVRWLAN
jgi:hypothetical protein